MKSLSKTFVLVFILMATAPKVNSQNLVGKSYREIYEKFYEQGDYMDLESDDSGGKSIMITYHEQFKMYVFQDNLCVRYVYVDNTPMSIVQDALNDEYGYFSWVNGERVWYDGDKIEIIINRKMFSDMSIDMNAIIFTLIEYKWLFLD